MDNSVGNSCPLRCKSSSKPFKRAALERKTEYSGCFGRFIRLYVPCIISIHLKSTSTILFSNRRTDTYVVQYVYDYQYRHPQIQLSQQLTFQDLPRFMAPEFCVRIMVNVGATCDVDFLEIGVFYRVNIRGRHHVRRRWRAGRS